jgi:hypothetical protein
MTPITNPALVPPGGLGGPLTPAGTPGAGKPADGTAGKPAGGAGGVQSGPSFADALVHAGKASDLQFSKHDQGTLGRLSRGVDRAAGKGSRDSLVLVDGTAFVVSVSNRTVITAVGSEHMKDNVFTNIDSAVIA